MNFRRKRRELIEMFQNPPDYKPPVDYRSIRDDVSYPNQNSLQFRIKPPDLKDQIYPFLDAIDINPAGHILVATNDSRGTVWRGSVWAFECPDEFPQKDRACYKMPVNGIVTGVHFVENGLFLIADASGSLQLYSSQSDIRNPNGYCLFSIGQRHEHASRITALDVLRAHLTKAVTGDADGCLKLWDMGEGDLLSQHAFRRAHAHIVTAVSSSPTEATQFVSASHDKSLLLWDYREPRPALGLVDGHPVALTAVEWDTHVLAGDDRGRLFQVDVRQPRRFVAEQPLLDRPLHRIKGSGGRAIVIGDTNEIKVVETDGLKTLFANKEAQNCVRDAVWLSEKSFFAVGWSTHFQKLEIE